MNVNLSANVARVPASATEDFDFFLRRRVKALRQNQVGLAEKTLCQLRGFSLVNSVGPSCNSSEVTREVANESILVL